ncbi:MAG: serine hydrolase [Cyanobacteria bacterium J06623_7]
MSRFKVVLTASKFRLGAAVAIAILSAVGMTMGLNWTFIRRLLTYPDNPITNTDWYQPQAIVKGNPRPLPTANPSTLDLASLERVSVYAAAADSSALLVMHRGNLVWERYWGEFDAASTSNSMSMSKTVLALLIGIAIAEGDIKSELEPVANYIAEWSVDDRRKITIQDLLRMQSGLENKDDANNPWSDLVQMYAGNDVDQVALKIPAARPPGEVFNYNNGNSQVLSEVLERATGEKYTDYLSSRLWQPLQADNAWLWLDRSQGNPKPFCCLFATPRDWGRVGQLFLTRGRVNNRQIVSESWLERMIQPSTLSDNYGYHLWLKARTDSKPGLYSRDAEQPFLAADTVYLDGASNQRVYIIPEQDLVIVRVGEKPQQWDDTVIPNILITSWRSRSRKKTGI